MGDFINYRTIVNYNSYSTGKMKNGIAIDYSFLSVDSTNIGFFNLHNKITVTYDYYEDEKLRHDVFSYNWLNENINEIKCFTKTGDGEWDLAAKHVFKYDNMINPFYNLGIEYNFGDLSRFLNASCKNNIISKKTYDNQDNIISTTTWEYQYLNGYPQSFKLDDGTDNIANYKYIYD